MSASRKNSVRCIFSMLYMYIKPNWPLMSIDQSL